MPDDTEVPFLSSLAHHAADPFRLLVESVVDYAIFMVDPAGRVASWNPGAERIYGYRAEEILEQPLRRLLPEDDPQDRVGGLLGSVDDSRFESKASGIRKDGSTFWAEVTISKLRDYFGNDAGFSVVTRDVSERTRAEEEVQRERSTTDAILASLPGVYYMYDEEFQFVRWNKRFEEVTEFGAEEIRALSPLHIFPEEEREKVAERIGNVFALGADDVEASLVSKSGNRTPYYFTGVRAEVDGTRYLLGMGIDISELKRAQAEARATDERLHQATRAARVGLWDWDLEANTMFYSEEWKRQLGCSGDEVTSDFEEWASRVHPNDLSRAKAELQRTLADPTYRYDLELRLRHKDGSYRVILSQAAVQYDERGVAARMLGSNVDVTEQRRLEKQLQHSQKMEAIGQLAAGVAHDFNNLLTVINGNSELLFADLPTIDRRRELVGEIHQAGTQAGNLTRQLLTFSRQQVVEPRVLDVNEVVVETERLLDRLLGANVALATSLGPNLAKTLADPGQMEQVLVNLAVNARDAMPGGGRLTIETATVDLDMSYCRMFAGLSPGKYVLLAVSDTGEGMDEATQARVFEPFFTTKPLGKGTGLGLATVHGIVHQARGHVAVYSEPGVGTTFKVYLPAVEAEVAPPTNGAVPDELARGTERVLLVEDDDAVRGLASRILRRCGYQVTEAPGGEEALRLFAGGTESFDLLLTDVVMARLGGRALAERVTALRPETRVLFFSGYTDDAIIRHGVLEAQFAFLQKPFTAAMLAQKVRSVLDGDVP